MSAALTNVEGNAIQDTAACFILITPTNLDTNSLHHWGTLAVVCNPPWPILIKFNAIIHLAFSTRSTKFRKLTTKNNARTQEHCRLQVRSK